MSPLHLLLLPWEMAVQAKSDLPSTGTVQLVVHLTAFVTRCCGWLGQVEDADVWFCQFSHLFSDTSVQEPRDSHIIMQMLQHLEKMQLSGCVLFLVSTFPPLPPLMWSFSLKVRHLSLCTVASAPTPVLHMTQSVWWSLPPQMSVSMSCCSISRVAQAYRLVGNHWMLGEKCVFPV